MIVDVPDFAVAPDFADTVDLVNPFDFVDAADRVDTLDFRDEPDFRDDPDFADELECVDESDADAVEALGAADPALAAAVLDDVRRCTDFLWTVDFDDTCAARLAAQRAPAMANFSVCKRLV